MSKRNSEKFDVAVAGTPEREWLQLLDMSPFETPRASSLLVVAPHPDDETLGAGGLIHYCAQIQRPIRLIAVTQGEAAWPGDADLARIRTRELRSSLTCLTAAATEVCHLQIADGRVAEHEERIYQAITARLRTNDLLVAPYEHDGHPDHDAVGRVCLDIARRHGVRLLRYPIWAWHQLRPQTFRGASFTRFALSQEAQRAKQWAISQFVSQLQPADGRAAVLPAHVLQYFARPYEAFLT